MSIDDFRWEEYGFDTWLFAHKTRELIAAKLSYYSGWNVFIAGQGPSDHIHVDSLDAAKTIAAILVAQKLEDFSDEKHYRKRPEVEGRKAFPDGVFKLV